MLAGCARILRSRVVSYRSACHSQPRATHQAVCSHGHKLGFPTRPSLDLGVPGKYSNPGKTSEEQFIALHIFAQRQTLTRLWLSKVSFPTIGSHKTIKIQDIAIALGSTVSDLGLYECLFRSYIDTISFIRAFPHCGSLYIRDCVSSAKNSSGEVFLGLPMHNLSLNALELSSSSSNGSIIDVSTLVEDAGLDVARLSALTCDVGSVAQAHSVAKATSVSPIRHFRLTSTRSGAFHGACEIGCQTVSYHTLTFSASYSSVPVSNGEGVASGVLDDRTTDSQNRRSLLA